MPTEILMPALSPTMEEGKLAKWLVKEGQTIKAGDVIAEIETDKATMEVEASDEGKLGKILVAEGTEGVKVNTPIATLLAEGESAGAEVASKTPSAKPAPAKAPSPQPSPQRGEGVRAASAAPARAAPSSSPTPIPSPQGGGSNCGEGGGHYCRRWISCEWSRPHLRVAAGAQACKGARRRCWGAERLGSPWAHHQAGR